MRLGRRWYRFRWWLAQAIAPRDVFVLQARGGDNRHDVTLHSPGARVWGTGWRYVTPLVARKLEGRDGHALDSLSMFRRAGRYPDAVDPSDYYEPEALPDEGVARELDVSFESASRLPPCPTCRGSGFSPDTHGPFVPCHVCGGSGKKGDL